MAVHSGSWSLFGYQLPDFGITEKLTSNRTAQGGSNLFGPQQASSGLSSPTSSSAPVYGPAYPGGSVLGASAASGQPTQQQNSGSTGPSAEEIFRQQQEAEAARYRAELASANSQYDRLLSDLGQQEQNLGTQRQNALSGLTTAYNATEQGVGQKKQESQNLTDTAIGQAGDTARSTQRINRNVLRALGILNSTYAADKLQAPMNQFDVQRADLNRQNVANIQQLDNFLVQQKGLHEQAVKEIEANYTNLIGQIQNDRRFTARDRLDAVQQANAALQQRLSDIGTSYLNYQNQVNNTKAQLAQNLASVQLQQNPQANLSSIMNTSMAQANQMYQTPQTAGIYDNQKRLLSDIYGK